MSCSASLSTHAAPSDSHLERLRTHLQLSFGEHGTVDAPVREHLELEVRFAELERALLPATLRLDQAVRVSCIVSIFHYIFVFTSQ